MFLTRFTVAHKGLILVSVPLLSGIVFTVLLVLLLQQSGQDLQEEMKAKEILGVINRLTVHMIDAATARVATRINNLSSDPGGSQYWLTECRGDLKTLKELVKNDPAERQKVDQLDRLLDSTTHGVEQAMGSDDEKATTLNELFATDQIEVIDSYITNLTTLTEEALLPINRADSQGPVLRARDRQYIQQALISAVVLNVLLTLCLAFYFSKTISQRLTKVKANAGRIARRLPLEDQLSGHDEIADLDKAFHGAAAELERLEKVKQSLISVVSHDMRTPLTSIQNIFYLAGKGAFGTMPEAAQNVLETGENESARVIEIINELLDAERLEQPIEP